MDRYKHFFYNNLDLACFANLDGYFEELNDNFTKVLGYTTKDLTEKKFVDFIHPDDVEPTLLLVGELSLGHKASKFVNRYKAKSGIYKSLEWSATINLETKKIYAIARDITEQVAANKELAFQNKEKEKREAELTVANKELAFQNGEKEKRAAELVVANEELAFQNGEKEKRAGELTIANSELAFQNKEKEKRADELTAVNIELAYQNGEKEKRAAELVIANKELAYQNEEKEKRAGELTIANGELAYQNKEKEKRADELTVANVELAYQNGEKEKRAAELVVANKELAYQNEEKEKRAGELTIANGELAYQNKEKEKRADELTVANVELAFQNGEKEKRAAELVVANKELAFQNEEKEKRATELMISNSDLKKAEEKVINANRLYSILSHINQTIVHIKDEELLFKEACRIAVELGKFKMAWIGLFDHSNQKMLMVEQSGIPAGKIAQFTEIQLHSNGPANHVLHFGEFYACNNIRRDFELEDWKQFAGENSIDSFMVLPIKKAGKIIGTFNLYASELNFFDKEEIALLIEVTGDISFALEIFEMEAEHKLAELERVKITDDLIQRNKDLEQFSYIISHNLRAPVANIIGLAAVAQKENLHADLKREILTGLALSSKNLDEVIIDLNNILQTKRDVSQKKELVYFSKITKDIHSSISELIETKKAVIVSDFSAVDEILTLKSYLHSIFYNLISNSLKYHQPNVPPVIEIKSRRMDNKIELLFKDNGLGIDLESKGDKVFGLYKRFHTEIAEGKGMGLYMVKTQVESIGGKISIESEVNKGTTFKIEFSI